MRDYIDVNDLADSHLVAYEKNSKNFETYNVGTGKGTSVLEIIKMTEEVSGKKIPYEITSRRPGDIASVFASPEKIHTELGWQAKNSIRDAILSGWKFVKNNL